jgi:L-alanine-DL-glutamate epimerase-like enolase superfamily enzyme
VGLAAHFHLSAALANAVHCDADVPWRPGGFTRDLGSGLATEVVDGVSFVKVPEGPGLGVTLDEEAVAAQRATRRW